MIRLIIVFMSFSVLVQAQKNFLQYEEVKLSRPFVSVSDFFFETNTTMTIAEVEKGAYVMYVYNDVATADYTAPKQFRHSFKVSATTMGEGFIASDPTEVQAVKLPLQPTLTISSNRLPSEKYKDGGLDILIDRKKGDKDFHEGWLGYKGDTISYNLSIENRRVYMVKVSALCNQNSWIFSPAKVEVYHKGQLLAATEIEKSSEKQEEGFEIITIPIEHITLDKIEVRIIAPEFIPEWHPGAGSKPWIFIDEVLVY